MRFSSYFMSVLIILIFFFIPYVDIKMQSSMSRITIGLALLVILSIVIMECSGNPSSETGDPNVANAIRWEKI